VALALETQEYYSLLSSVRKTGDWESWILFFLEGVEVSAKSAEENIVKLATLVATDRKRLLGTPNVGTASYRLFEMLPMMPRFTVERVRAALDTSFPTANAAVKTLEKLGLIVETTGNKVNRSFSYERYIQLLSS
jgi:Fic family protein